MTPAPDLRSPSSLILEPQFISEFVDLSKLLSIYQGESHLPEDDDALNKKFQKFSCICGVKFFLGNLADHFAYHGTSM